MDIQDIHNHFDISVKKLHRMERAGVLRVGKSSAPLYWQCVRSDIRKGKLSARSIALAYRFPEKLDSVMQLTASGRRVIDAHFRQAELPVEISPVQSMSTLIFACAIREHPNMISRFIDILRETIPDREVGYLFVAVRLLLMCETDHQINLASDSMQRGLQNALDHPSMRGWSRREPGRPGKYRIIYRRPAMLYDL